MSIKCGNCKDYHNSIAEVRQCCVAGEGDVYIGPTRTIAEMRPEITEGMWLLGERIIKVQKAVHGSGNLYGKELVVKPSGYCRVCGYLESEHPAGDPEDPEDYCGPEGYREMYSHYWEKLTGAVRMLREQGGVKMTLEEAVQYGDLYGFCCRCGRTLTNETSIEAGIGPICAGKFA